MRLTQLRQKLAEQELDAILITQPENRRYLSGFTGSDGVLIISAEAAYLATDFRYYEQVERQAPEFTLAKVEGKFPPRLAELISELGAQRVGFESTHVTVDQHQQWAEAAACALQGECFELVPTKGIVEELRAVKDNGELAAIQQAVKLSDAALAHIVEWLRPEMTEKEVAWELEAFMRTHGAEAVAFNPIVGSGPNGAMAHVEPSDRRIQEGEPIVIDLGARVDGYCSDLTRTICVGEPQERFCQIYAVVLEAQEAAEGAMRAGLKGSTVDAIARDLIETAGYGEHFGHSLGHGVGLAIHEGPRISKTSEDELQAGMVVTIEPGIYIEGWGGVRIEDLAVVEEQGVDVLTTAPKGLTG
ncbi:MAG: Xaa-Pro peptidase family protein [Chloroflexota bacterium]|nr:Xaa-Pro peptidase family protein [Chloroflexota bacterium]